MAEKKYEETIIDMVKRMNKRFDKEGDRLERYEDRYKKAMKDGATKEYLDALNDAILKISDSIESQKEYTSKFYEEMVKTAGGRRDLDENMLADVLKFREEFVKATEHMEKLKISYKNTKRNKAEKLRLSNEIDKLSKAIDANRAGIIAKYGKGSYADKATKGFKKGTKEYKELLEVLNKRLASISVDYRKINEEEKRSNEILEKNLRVWNAIKAVGSEVFKQVKDGALMWLKYNAQAIASSKRLGITTKDGARAYTQYLMATSKELSRNFAITADQAMKMQDAFSKATGKASLLSKSQIEDIAATSKIIGDETVSSAIEMMDNMGSTSQQATELLDKNYARAANSGLDTVKASEAFVKNMSLANKLTFRNGVDGISKMTIYSQKIKMDLQEVASVADKFSSIEGAIEGSAKLQVLGGSGAMFGGNPMQMMYEALSDPEALFKRMSDMFGTQAVFDRKTGEARIDPIQLQIMREQAKAIGMNPDTAVQTAKAQAKNKDIESYAKRLVDRYGKDSEELSSIENKAQFNKDTGQWQITFQDETGETHENVDVKTLTESQMRSIMKDRMDPVEDIRGNVRKIAIALIGTEERWKSMQDQWKTSKAQLLNSPMQGIDTALTGINNENPFNDGSIMTALGIGALGVGAGVTAYSAQSLRSLGKQILSGRGIGPSGVAGSVGSGVNPPVDTGGGTTTGTPRTGGGAASNGSKFARYRKLVKLKNSKIGKFASKSGRVAKLGSVISVAAGAYTMYDVITRANEDYDVNAGATRGLFDRGVISEGEAKQRDIYAKNQRTGKRSEAIGEGLGVAGGGIVGAKLGATIGSVIAPGIGTAIGGAIGGIAGGIYGAYAGKKAGGAVGKEFQDHSEDDAIAKEIEKIDDSNTKENLRRIVLPVESIDYNVAFIARQLGNVNATAARNNVYLTQEGMMYASEIGADKVEGKYIEASVVNEPNANSQQGYSREPVEGSISLKVSGSIDLNGGAKMTANDIKKLIEGNQALQREIIDIITSGLNRNGNAGRNANENWYNRNKTSYGLNQMA